MIRNSISGESRALQSAYSLMCSASSRRWIDSRVNGTASVMKPGLLPVLWIDVPPRWQAASMRTRSAGSTLAEMYVKGVSTRKVKAITEELCAHAFSSSTISAINKKLDGRLAAFAQRRLDEPFPYLILDARYEKVREGGVVGSQAVLIAIGIDRSEERRVGKECDSTLRSRGSPKH